MIGQSLQLGPTYPTKSHHTHILRQNLTEGYSCIQVQGRVTQISSLLPPSQALCFTRNTATFVHVSIKFRCFVTLLPFLVLLILFHQGLSEFGHVPKLFWPAKVMIATDLRHDHVGKRSLGCKLRCCPKRSPVVHLV